MKNTDKTIPYQPSQADLDRFRIWLEKMNFSSSIQDDHEEKTAGKPNMMNKLAILAVLVVLVVVILIMIGMWNSPLSLATVSWNG
jgi:uncharacterized membrane protein YiaA